MHRHTPAAFATRDIVVRGIDVLAARALGAEDFKINQPEQV
jgi:hypothetical protein